MYLGRSIRELSALPVEQLLANRYDKFRRMGAFLEGGVPSGSAGEALAAASSGPVTNGAN
jgi:hypothetical protein